MQKFYNIAISCILLLFVSIWFYFIGYQLASEKYSASKGEIYGQTFYATITDIADETISVAGMDINDINYRGDFTFSVTPKTTIEWRGETLLIEQLRPGELISITFVGEILETYPSQIENVVRIQLLNDEK